MKKKIEISNRHFEEFDVIDIDVKVGQHIWFDVDGWWMEAEVKEVNPDHWWIYDEYDKENPKKVLGCVSCVVVNPPSWLGHPHYQVDFCDICLEKPEDYDLQREDDEDYESEKITIQDIVDVARERANRHSIAEAELHHGLGGTYGYGRIENAEIASFEAGAKWILDKLNISIS